MQVLRRSLIFVRKFKENIFYLIRNAPNVSNRLLIIVP